MTTLMAQSSGRPLFLHFFNPDCPCSRFNQDHVRDLIRAHGHDATFVAVIEPEGSPLAEDAAATATHDLGVPAVIDEDGDLARQVGVYSTPQAVIVATDGWLYFRGNYNAARYCTDERSEHARIALEHALAGDRAFEAPPGSNVAYGCPLPLDVATAREGR